MIRHHLDEQSGQPSDTLVELIYECVLRDDRLRVMLEAVADRFGGASAILVYVDQANSVAAFSLACGVIDDPEVQRRYNDEFATMDPAPVAMSSLKPGQAASTDLMFTASMSRYKPFIEGFLHPLGLGGGLAGVVANGDGKIGFFAVHRPRERRIFDEGDVAAFESVLKHVVRMLDLRQVFYHMARQIGAQQHALDQTATGVILVGQDRQILQANVASRTILARDDGLHLNARGMLIVRNVEARQTLDATFARNGAGGTIVVVPRTDASLPYVLRVANDEDAAGFRHRTIHIWDPDRQTGGCAALLQQAFGLTTSSAKLLSALLTGETLDSYAVRNKLSRSTAKFHLNAAFAATGTRRQAELLRLANALTCNLSPSGWQASV